MIHEEVFRAIVIEKLSRARKLISTDENLAARDLLVHAIELIDLHFGDRSMMKAEATFLIGQCHEELLVKGLAKKSYEEAANIFREFGMSQQELECLKALRDAKNAWHERCRRLWLHITWLHIVVFLDAILEMLLTAWGPNPNAVGDISKSSDSV